MKIGVRGKLAERGLSGVASIYRSAILAKVTFEASWENSKGQVGNLERRLGDLVEAIATGLLTVDP